MLILVVHLSPLAGCIDHRWTSLSLSALWSFIQAYPVGSSPSLNVVALPTTYLLKLVLLLGFVLVTFLAWNEVVGIPQVLSSISDISGRGYWFFTGALLRDQYSSQSRSPPSFFLANQIGAAARSVYHSQLLVSLALSEIS
jgi:hypothetical protein